MAATDFITFFLSILFLVRGSSRGFMNSLIGPFSIIVTTIISIIYYQTTNDIIASVSLGLIGPLLLIPLLKFLLKKWAKATNREIKPGFLSCLAGSILTLIWGWVFIILILILLTVLPPWGKPLAVVHNDVANSFSYLLVNPLKNILFAPSKQNATALVSEAPNQDAKSLAQDPRFQKILQDPDIQKEIDAHDFVKLMSNPKMMDLVQQIMSDPVAMKKVMALYRSQAEELRATHHNPN